jgi:hypothetical protein
MRALAAHETGWDQHAVNLWHPGDIARGGAWGIMQITEKTARMYGYTASVGQLLDARVNFELGGRILADGRCQTLQDAGAWWNAGRRRFEDLPADHVTRKAYVPKLLAAAEKDKKGGVA